MHCYVRLMRREDITRVTEIDREAFPTLWPPANYKREINNPLAHYMVACDEENKVERTVVKATPQKRRSGLASGVKRLFNYIRFLGNEPPPSDEEYISGFAGFWIMAGEVHITNIAVRKILHNQGIGELLLIALIDLAAKLDARMITLEVRVSNIAAISLYYKYDFAKVGLRRGYYIEDKEDAVLMSIEDITSAPFQTRLQQLKRAYSKRWGIAIHPAT